MGRGSSTSTATAGTASTRSKWNTAARGVGERGGSVNLAAVVAVTALGACLGFALLVLAPGPPDARLMAVSAGWLLLVIALAILWCEAEERL